MKIFLSALAIIFLVLTVISKIRRRFKPGSRPNQTPIIIGIIVSALAAVAIVATYYYSGETQDLTKLALPTCILFLLIDQYRRNRKYYQ